MLYYLRKCILDTCRYNYSTAICYLLFCSAVLVFGVFFLRGRGWEGSIVESWQKPQDWMYLARLLFYKQDAYNCTSLRNCWLKPITLFTLKTTQSVCLKRVGRKSLLAVTTESVADCPSGRAPEKGKGKSQLPSLSVWCMQDHSLWIRLPLWKTRSVQSLCNLPSLGSLQTFLAIGNFSIYKINK